MCLRRGKECTHNPQNKTKKFNTDASVRYKRKADEEHASTDQHFAAEEAELMNWVSTFQKQIDRREQVKDELYYNAFLSMYWIAKEELPNCKFVRLIELLRLLKLPDIQYFNHNSAGSVREMFLTLGEIVREQVLLLREDCKLLLNVHCICHRLALACGDANDQVSYIKTIEKVLLQLWAFFKNSSK